MQFYLVYVYSTAISDNERMGVWFFLVHHLHCLAFLFLSSTSITFSLYLNNYYLFLALSYRFYFFSYQVDLADMASFAVACLRVVSLFILWLKFIFITYVDVLGRTFRFLLLKWLTLWKIMI